MKPFAFYNSSVPDLLPLTQIPLKHRKSLLSWLGSVVAANHDENPSIPAGMYEFWLDNLSNQPLETLLDF